MRGYAYHIRGANSSTKSSQPINNPISTFASYCIASSFCELCCPYLTWFWTFLINCCCFFPFLFFSPNVLSCKKKKNQARLPRPLHLYYFIFLLLDCLFAWLAFCLFRRHDFMRLSVAWFLIKGIERNYSSIAPPTNYAPYSSSSYFPAH